MPFMTRSTICQYEAPKLPKVPFKKQNEKNGKGLAKHSFYLNHE